MKNNFKLYFETLKEAKLFMLSLPYHFISENKRFIIASDYRIDLYKTNLEVMSNLTETEFRTKFIN